MSDLLNTAENDRCPLSSGAESLKIPLSLLSAALKLRKIDAALQEILIKGITGLMKTEGVTLQRKEACAALMADITAWCRKPESETGEGGDAFLYHLLRLGFRGAEFTAYYKHIIDAELAAFYLEQERFERLAWYEKQFSILPKGTPSLPGPAAGKALLEYVRAGLWYIQQKQIYHLASFNGNCQIAGHTQDYRIRVAISADALAYLFKLLIEAGVVVASPRSKLLSFVARSFETNGIGAGLLSANSLGKKYEQVVQSTANSVRIMLMRMLKNLDKAYG